MASEVEFHFKNLATRLGVSEGDVLTLLYYRVNSAGSFYFRMPSSEALERFLTQYVSKKVGIIVDGGVELIDRNADDIAGFEFSEEAGALRRLWEASKTLAKEDLNRTTTGKTSANDRSGQIVVQDFFRRALANGIYFPSDRVKPGPNTVLMIHANFAPQGAHAYIDWEYFVSELDEDKFNRSSKHQKKEFLTAQREGGELKLSTMEQEHRLKGPKVEQLVQLQDMFDLRAYGHVVAQVCSLESYQSLNKVLMHGYRAEVPAKMRGPTLHEVRMVDRLIHTEILKWVALGEGDLDDGLAFYGQGDGRQSPFFSFLEPVAENHPDRGIEKMSRSLSLEDTSSAPARDSGPKTGSGYCDVCGKHRDEHEKRRFCEDPDRVAKPKVPKAPPQERASPLKKGAGKDKTGKDKNKGKRKLPEFLKGCAMRMPANADNPYGQEVCIDWNDPAKGCRGTRCVRYHKCPKFKKDGTICGEDHIAINHVE